MSVVLSYYYSVQVVGGLNRRNPRSEKAETNTASPFRLQFAGMNFGVAIGFLNTTYLRASGLS